MHVISRKARVWYLAPARSEGEADSNKGESDDHIPGADVRNRIESLGDIEGNNPGKADEERAEHYGSQPRRAFRLKRVFYLDIKARAVLFLLLANPRLRHGRQVTREDGSMETQILVVDNYDSFVFNLVQYLEQLGAKCTVVRNDSIPADAADQFDGVLVSPGPGTPEAAGISIEIIRRSTETNKPLLGVCLGHQAIAVAFGATVDRAPELLHGKTSNISHDASGVFENLPSPFIATRYHSLAIKEETLTEDLIVTGRSESGVVMAVRHKQLPIFGVQFHPESVLTEHGHKLLANWLVHCGMKDAVKKAEGLAPVVNR